MCALRPPRSTFNAEASSQPPSNPTLLYSLSGLEDALKAAYKLVRTLPMGAHSPAGPRRPRRSSSAAKAIPVLPLHGAPLDRRPRCAVKVTEGKFSDALRSFTRMLHIIPLTLVDSRKVTLAPGGSAGPAGGPHGTPACCARPCAPVSLTRHALPSALP